MIDESNLFKKADMLLKYSKTGKWEWNTALALPCKAISAGNSLLASGNQVLFDLVWLLTSILRSTNYKQYGYFSFLKPPPFIIQTQWTKYFSLLQMSDKMSQHFCSLQLPDREGSSSQSDTYKQMHPIRKRSSETTLLSHLYESYVPGKQVRLHLQSCLQQFRAECSGYGPDD